VPSTYAFCHGITVITHGITVILWYTSCI